MIAASFPVSEEARRAALQAISVVDSAPEPEFDALVRAASMICGTPISLLSLVDGSRQWFKANLGLPGTSETPRELAFCGHTILGDDVFEVPDAAQDSRFADNPLVTGEPGVRFYAGAPIRLGDGSAVGALCVIDRQPRQLNAGQRSALASLAEAASRLLEGRRAMLAEGQLLRDAAKGRLVLEHSADAIIELAPDWTVLAWNAAAARLFGGTRESGASLAAEALLECADGGVGCRLRAALAGDPASRHFEGTAIRFDGACVPVAITSVSQPDEQGEPAGCILFLRDQTGQKRVMAALAERELRLQDLYDRTPGMLHSIDPEGRLLSVSDEWLATLGYSRGEVLGVKSTMFMTAASRDHAVNAVLPEFFRSGACKDVEYQMVCKNGDVIDVLLSAVLERNPAGEPIRSLAVVSDVTARRRTEHALRESEARYKALVEDQGEMVSLSTLEGKLLFVNEAYAKHFGLTPNALIGCSLFDYIPAPEHDAVRQHLRQVTESGIGQEGENRMASAGGEPRWVAWSNRAVTRADGSVSAIHSVGRDVTERRRLEAQVISAAKEIENLYDCAPCGYHSVGADGKYLRINATELAWLGYSRDEVVGQYSPIDFCGPGQGEILQQAFLAAKQTGQSQNVEVMLVGRDQVPRDVSINISVITDDDGEFVMTRSVMFDISNIKRAERAVLKLHREQTAILNNDLVGIARVRDRHYFWANVGLERILGYGNGELNGASTRIVYASEQEFEAAGRDALATVHRGDTYRGELRLIQKSGNPIWVAVTGAIFDADTGESLWMHSDITARKCAEEALRSSQEFLARTGAVAGVGGWALDIATSMVTWSDETCRLHDVPPGYRPTLQEAVSYYTPESRPVIAAAVQKGIEQGQSWDVELSMTSSTGRPFWARAVGEVEWRDGQPVRLIGAIQDVTERRKVDRALADSHELLRVTLDSIGDAVITTDVAGRIEWLNPVAERLTGWIKTEAHGRDVAQVFRILHEGTRKPAVDPVRACLAQGKVVGLANHTVLVSRDGNEYGIEDSASPIRDREGRVLGAVLVFHDVSEQRRLSNEMRYRATHDALTDLPNRTEFEMRLERLISSAKRRGTTHALMYVDLDQFKLVNDACGHSVGDQLLRQIAAMLIRSVRGRDTVARLGGDEFALLLENCDSAHAQSVGKKICDQMDEFRFIHDGRRFRIGTSIGLVQIDARWADVPALMQAADSACYTAKEAGRNRVHAWFDTDSQARARLGEVNWVSKLEQALDDGLFTLVAQQIQSVGGGQNGLHCEVLLRLPQEDGSLVAPGAFLPAAERFHLMPRVDRWVVRRVLDLLAAECPSQQGIEMVAINLSGQSIGDRTFHRDVMAMILAAPFDPGRLCFEITETAAITNLPDARSFFQEVRALGVRVALDDFGAGASSFGYLKSLPVDFLKIDGQFIRDILEDPLDSAAVRSFRDVAGVVGVKTIAECVESTEVRDLLTRLGIDMLQGFLIHRPEPLGNLLARFCLHGETAAP